MPSLKSIKKRISSVKNTQKITKAMKMVAAAKLRRAQQAVLGARPYANAILELSGRLAASQGESRHPLTVAQSGVSKKEYLIFTSDRGLCGGFNGNLLRQVGNVLIGNDCRVVGKKGRDYFKSKGWTLAESVTGIYENLGYSIPLELARVAVSRFEAGKVGEVWIVFNRFKSMLTQEITFQKILPISERGVTKRERIDYIYEPSNQILLDKLLRERLVTQIYQAFLESVASELAARMTAMDNATHNASDMISYLTLQYNRARQATITKELMDIVNGAEALR